MRQLLVRCGQEVGLDPGFNAAFPADAVVHLVDEHRRMVTQSGMAERVRNRNHAVQRLFRGRGGRSGLDSRHRILVRAGFRLARVECATVDHDVAGRATDQHLVIGDVEAVEVGGNEPLSVACLPTAGPRLPARPDVTTLVAPRLR